MASTHDSFQSPQQSLKKSHIAISSILIHHPAFSSGWLAMRLNYLTKQQCSTDTETRRVGVCPSVIS